MWLDTRGGLFFAQFILMPWYVHVPSKFLMLEGGGLIPLAATPGTLLQII